MKKLITTITEKDGMLIIRTPSPSMTERFIPYGDSRIGCVLIDTGRNLGISKKAMALLRQIPKSYDDLGDVDSFKSGPHTVFGWLGPPNRKMDPQGVAGSQTWTADIPHVTVPNKEMGRLRRKR